MTRHSLQSRSIGFTTIGLLASLGIGSVASADPLPGEILKFQQLPLDGVTPIGVNATGHDEPSTAIASTSSGGFNGVFAADDFSDRVNANITHVQWWGSYTNLQPGQTNPFPAQNFLVSFEADVPSTVNPNGTFSQPGTVLSQQVVSVAPSLSPGSGKFTETLQDGSIPEPLYRYNAELANPFPEQANTIYWLKIVALNAPNDTVKWGWHNRDYGVQDLLAAPVVPGESNIGTAVSPVWHFQDDAVSGVVNYLPAQNILNETGMTPLLYNTTTDGFVAGAAPPSEDLAFGLYYSVPEPAALPLLAMGFSLFRRNRRRTNAGSTDTGVRESIFQLPKLPG